MKIASTLLIAILMSATGAAQASLIDRGGGLIYDTDLNITWLSNANYGAGSSYDNGYDNTDGVMTWSHSMAWAANLSYYDSVRDQVLTGWRLPTTLQPDSSCDSQFNGASWGRNCSGSEMGHMYYVELGGNEYSDILTTHNEFFSLFQNIKSAPYWSSTIALPSEYNYAWYFDFGMYGGQATLDTKRNFPDFMQNTFLFAWAVRDGDVGAAPAATVPVPTAIWLFGSGLLGLISVARRKAA